MSRILKYVVICAISVFVPFAVIVSIPRNSIVVSDQPKGQAIHLSRVELAKGGFVLINALDKTTNLPDEMKILNIPVYLPAGIYKDMTVLLNNDALIEESGVSVSLYEDKGDPGVFGVYPDDAANSDFALKTWDGKLARKIIKVF